MGVCYSVGCLDCGTSADLDKNGPLVGAYEYDHNGEERSNLEYRVFWSQVLGRFLAKHSGHRIVTYSDHEDHDYHLEREGE